MKIITGGRQCGKTTALIMESAETGSTIVCAHTSEARRIQRQAFILGVVIPEPMSFHKLISSPLNSRYPIKGVLIDDAEAFIQFAAHIPVKTIAIDFRDDSRLVSKEIDQNERFINYVDPRFV